MAFKGKRKETPQVAQLTVADMLQDLNTISKLVLYNLFYYIQLITSNQCYYIKILILFRTQIYLENFIQVQQMQRVLNH